MVRGLLADGLIERVDDAYVPAGDLSRLRVPESLRLLIAARLDALDRTDRALLQDAAVLGQVFAVGPLAAVSGTDEADLEGRLRAFVRRELLDIETDPRSPERGQYRFVQALIREVAYGTLARRDRRARHLAAARHFEGVGDDELAGVLASHYLAAHEASEPGAEADAIATQARLALTSSAQRAATLGAHEQAIRHVEQALGIARDPRERAPLLDIAASSAAAAAVPEARQYAEAAVTAYRELSDETGVVLATVRLGRVLINAGDIGPARQVLEGVVPAAEAIEDRGVLAFVLSHLARAYMRNAESVLAVDAADRSLAIAEALDLEEVVAEAMLNKGSALNQLGRRREANALVSVAVDLARRAGDRAMEIRALNNYGVGIVFDDPVRAHEIYRQITALARDVGDMGMYLFSLSNLSGGSLAMGLWHEAVDELREAYEAASLPSDRVRVGIQLALPDMLRGNRVEEWRRELRALVADREGFEYRFPLLMIEAQVARASGDFEAAYRRTVEAYELHGPNPEIPAFFGLHVAIASRDAELIRAAVGRVAELQLTGAIMNAVRHAAHAAVAALDGRTAEAVAGFAAGYDILQGIGVSFEAAMIAVDASILLPDHPDLRSRVAEARSLLAELGARPTLESLDAAESERRGDRSEKVASASAEIS
jgi:tetratricopeptide (TPR) repeat protein